MFTYLTNPDGASADKGVVDDDPATQSGGYFGLKMVSGGQYILYVRSLPQMVNLLSSNQLSLKRSLYRMNAHFMSLILGRLKKVN